MDAGGMMREVQTAVIAILSGSCGAAIVAGLMTIIQSRLQRRDWCADRADSVNWLAVASTAAWRIMGCEIVDNVQINGISQINMQTGITNAYVYCPAFSNH